MRIIAWKTLRRFGEQHRNAMDALRAWKTITEHALWQNPAELRRSFNTADFVGKRVVFDIMGNRYRLVAEIDYQRAVVFTIWIGTHAEYDDINVRTVRYEAGNQAGADRSGTRRRPR